MLAGAGYGEEAALAVRAAALRGGATLYASGVYPGHVPMVALAASAMCQRVDRISVLESLDISGYASEPMFRVMGFDLEPDDPRAPKAVEGACGSFKDQIAVMAHALHVDLDGEPSARLTLQSPDGHFDGAVTTAMPCVNAIPAVCAAPPGILNHGTLPLICGTRPVSGGRSAAWRWTA